MQLLPGFTEPEIPLGSSEARIVLSLVTGAVKINDAEIALSNREYELLFFLALHQGVASTDLLSESLWPESDADRARTSLKVTISRLRLRLGDASLIRATKNGYKLLGRPQIDILNVLESHKDPYRDDGHSLVNLRQARLRLSNWPWAKMYESRFLTLEVARAQEIGA
jgi:DNA-binding winged helix-turn-helix (wHTH) protein